MTARAVLAALFLCGTSAIAGNYWLTIANDQSSSCATEARAPGGVVASAADVARDIARHFSGEEPALPVFAAVFGNARVTFCGDAERETVYEALTLAALGKSLQHEGHLADYALMLGSNRLIKMLDARIGALGKDGFARERLTRMRDAAAQGVDFRRQRGHRTKG